jgi:hypothetical protein
MDIFVHALVYYIETILEPNLQDSFVMQDLHLKAVLIHICGRISSHFNPIFTLLFAFWPLVYLLSKFLYTEVNF